MAMVSHLWYNGAKSMHTHNGNTDGTKHKPETAGHRMTAQVPVVTETQTLSEVRELLTKSGAGFKTVHYIYVVDAKRTFTGVLSVGDLFSSDLDRKVGDVCKRTPLVFTHPEAHQEHAAYLALKHGVKAIPIVDSTHRFLGVITSDEVLRILHKEMHEDAMKRAGIRHPAGMHANVLELSTLQSLRHRIPWLIVGLIGGLLAAKIVTLFEVTLEQNLILASFIPLIVYMSNAVRTQMEAYIIRDLALDRSLPFLRYLLRHLLVLVLLAFSLSALLFVSLGVIHGDWHIASVLSAALGVSIFSSVITGLLIPYMFEKMKLDPADASGPVATIIQDMMSIVIYFGIATLLL